MKSLVYKFLYLLNRLQIFAKLFKTVFNFYLINRGYCENIGLLPILASNQLYVGENIFISKFKKLKIKNCIDIGSNQGEYAKQILLNTDIKKVICFEPLPECSNNLSILKSLYKGRLHFYKLALSNKNGFSYIYYNQKKTALASLELSANNITYVNNNQKKKISIKKLDNFIYDEYFKNIDFVKIDTEGHEKKVIEGMKNFLAKKKIKLIQIEFGIHHLITGDSIFNISRKFNGYIIGQLNLMNGRLLIINPQDFLSNIYINSVFVFVRKDFFRKNFNTLLN